MPVTRRMNLVIADTDYVVPIYVRTDRAPFKDNRVREAMRLAADRSQLVQDAYLSYGSLGNDLFGHGVPYYDSGIPQHPHDPEKAKALLKQAGFADGLNVTLYTSTAAPGMLQSAQIYAQQAKAAGINVKLFQTPANTYYSGQYYLKVAMGQTNYQGIIPVMWSDALLKTSPYNETAWDRPDFDKAFYKAEATQDPDCPPGDFQQPAGAACGTKAVTSSGARMTLSTQPARTFTALCRAGTTC